MCSITSLSRLSRTAFVAGIAPRLQRLDQQRQIERRRGVGEGADRDVVDAGGGDLANGLERDAARCFELDVGAHAIARGNRLAKLRRRHVVEQDSIDAGGERRLHLADVAALDLDRARRTLRAGEPHRLDEPAHERDVVLLDQDRVVEAHPVIPSASGRDRRLLERAHGGRGLARIEDRDPAVRARDISGGQRGDAREVAEEVERRTPRGEELACGALDLRHLARHLIPPLGLSHQRLEVAGTSLRERLRGGVQPEHHAGLLLHDPRERAHLRGHDRRGRDVTGADVLGKSARDEIARLRVARHRLSASSAIVAVKPCRKLRPPTGPISPAQKKPAAGIPNASWIALASWSGTSNICEPRPLQVKSSAPAGGDEPSTSACRRSTDRRSSSADAPSRTCIRTVRPTRTRSPTAIVPASRSAPMIGRTRKSPRRYSGLFSSITMPRRSPSAASAWSRGSSDAIASPSRSTAGFEASSETTLPSAAVIVISGPTGAAPCETQGSTLKPPSEQATAPPPSTSPPAKSVPDAAAPALARPAMIGRPGRASFSRRRSSSAGKVEGPARTIGVLPSAEAPSSDAASP